MVTKGKLKALKYPIRVPNSRLRGDGGYIYIAGAQMFTQNKTAYYSIKAGHTRREGKDLCKYILSNRWKFVHNKHHPEVKFAVVVKTPDAAYSEYNLHRRLVDVHGAVYTGANEVFEGAKNKNKDQCALGETHCLQVLKDVMSTIYPDMDFTHDIIMRVDEDTKTLKPLDVTARMSLEVPLPSLASPPPRPQPQPRSQSQPRSQPTYKYKTLEAAIKKGNAGLQTVKDMLAGGADVNAPSGNNAWTPLLYASSNGSANVVAALLKRADIDVNYAAPTGWTALTLAVDRNRASVVRKLLADRRVEIDAVQTSGGNQERALLHAIKGKHVYIVRLLLEKGANPTVAGNQEKAALMCALKLVEDKNKSRATIISELVSAMASPEKSGVDVNVKDSLGQTALTLAVEHNHAVDVSTLLSVKDLDVNVPGLDGRTALMSAVAAKVANEELVSKLLEKGADFNVADNHGYTSVIWAAAYGNVDKISAWEKKGANLHAPALDGVTALMAAAGMGHEKVVTFLLKKGVDINAVDSMGNNALMHCALSPNGFRGHPCSRSAEAAKVAAVLLSDKRIKVNETNNFGETALIIAVKRWAECMRDSVQGEIALELMRKGVDRNVVSREGRVFVWGAGIEEITDGRSALMLAAIKGRTDIIWKLLDIKKGRGVKPTDLDVVNQSGWTALMFAVQKGQVAAARVLLAEGADAGIKSHKKETAMSLAQGNTDMIAVLSKTRRP